MNTISCSAKKRDATRMREEHAEQQSKHQNGVLAPSIGFDQPADVPERNLYATPKSQLPTEKEKDDENWMNSIQLDNTLFQPHSSNASCSSTSAHQTATPLISKLQRDPPDHSDPDPPDSDDSSGSDD